jgi:5-methylthioadenosine/S-adenosylhomocysteine deaminase
LANIIIRNAYILTMDPERGEIQNGVIVIDNGLIREVAESTNESARKEIDAHGCVAMPGLVNTHCHIGMTLFRGYADDLPLKVWLEERIWPAESQTAEEDIYRGSLLGCMEMIRSGTTAFADMYFHMNRTAQAVEESGLRAALSYGMIDFGDTAKADAELKEGIRFCRDWNRRGDGRITTMYGPHAPNTCSREFLLRVKGQAEKDELGCHIHILETQGERDTMTAEHGMSSVKYLNNLGFFDRDVLAAHCVWVTEEEIGILADSGVHVSHNPVSNMKLGSGIAPVAKMLTEGVRVSLGTDGCASNNNLDMFEEMKTAALLQKVNMKDPSVLSAREVLKMGTVNGAKALGLNSGVLKAGFNADLILIDMKQAHLTPVFDVPSHLVYSASGRDVRTTIVNGSILMENSRIIGLDEEQILRSMEEHAKGLHFQS